jgi:hypothetical protein
MFAMDRSSSNPLVRHDAGTVSSRRLPPAPARTVRRSVHPAGPALATGRRPGAFAADLRERRGQPLPPSLSIAMGARMGHDFSNVVVHAGPDADRWTRAVGAQALTVGTNIAFGAGQYAPETREGRRLIAHELAHVVQQRGTTVDVGHGDVPMSKPGDAGERAADAAADAVGRGERVAPLQATPAGIQRACGRAALGAPAPACSPSDRGVVGWQLLFVQNCDDLRAGEASMLTKPRPGSRLNVHGFASIEGNVDYNMELSCHRANRVAELLRTSRPDCTVVGVFQHGAHPVSGPGLVDDLQPRSFWRSVIIEEVAPEPPRPQPPHVCGPDATDWLVAQTVAAKRNPKVLAIRNKLDAAAMLAPTITKKSLLNASDIVEGAIVTKIAQQRRIAGDPRPTPEANMQLGEPSAVAGLLEFQTAGLEALSANPAAITTLLLLRDAALEWKALVGTRMPFDFKNDPTTMGNPTSAHCPHESCRGTVTICPGSAGANCFGQDFPGNIVYGHVGAFVGFSENALQLGSQWAQLQSSRSWDPPEDTAMISFAVGLPTPFTRAGLCTALQGAKGSFETRPCPDCSEQTTARIVQ